MIALKIEIKQEKSLSIGAYLMDFKKEELLGNGAESQVHEASISFVLLSAPVFQRLTIEI